MPRILIIEDEKVIRSALSRLLQRHDFEVAEAGAIAEVNDGFDLADFDLIISDLRLPGPAGTDIISPAQNVGVPVLIMTSYASIKSAVEAMQQGATDYIAKPFDHDEMLHTINSILEKSRLQRQNAALKSDLNRTYPVAGIIGECAAMHQVCADIHKIAPTDSTVLILGESGTGKELVARALHEHSQRRDAPLIAVNCAAIPDDLIEPELFGHEKGAFTGAVGSREGLVEAADGGTLFLDEIGELPLVAQARLLRVLQEGEIRRVGSARTLKVDIRLIAATHRDLEQRVEDGLLRRDLYYRLRVMDIRLPPLRERGDDVIELAHYLLEKTRSRLNRGSLCFAPQTLTAIRSYDWPGNVREMENAIERAVILSDDNVIQAEQMALSHDLRITSNQQQQQVDMSLDDYFVHFVQSNQHQLTETELAKRLGISRKSLWERRQRLGMPKSKRSR